MAANVLIINTISVTIILSYNLKKRRDILSRPHVVWLIGLLTAIMAFHAAMFCIFMANAAKPEAL